MNIENALKQFGLDNKEIKIYLTLLQLGKATVLNIAKQSGIKRPTAYLVLESLVEKGLVSKIPRKNKTLFFAENPEKLAKILDKRKNDIEKIIPSLLGLYNLKDEKPQIRMYEGQTGVSQAYQEILKAKEIWWYGNLKSVHDNFRHIYEEFEILIKKNKIISKDFVGNSEWEKNYAKKNQRKNHEVRISALPINIDFSLFEDKISIMSLKKNFYALIIQDQAIVESFKNLYNMAWEKAGKFK